MMQYDIYILYIIAAAQQQQDRLYDMIYIYIILSTEYSTGTVISYDGIADMVMVDGGKWELPFLYIFTQSV